jgi:hypothetical protein
MVEMIESLFRNSLAQLHQFQDTSNDCGPYCTAMVINFLKVVSLSGEELGRKMDKMVWRRGVPIIRRVPNWATFPWGIVDRLKEDNISARWRIFQSEEKLLERLPNQVILIVIIGELCPMWTHYKILVARDEDLGWGFLDPSNKNGNTYWDTHTYFKSCWNNFGRQVIQIDLGK